jgi:hypothetical protein
VTAITMNQVIHGAVRRDFERLVSALGSLSGGETARARGLERAYANLRNQLTHHHEGEDAWLWPAMEKLGVDPDLLATMESEHQAMSDALAETDATMQAFAASGSATDAAAARESMLRTQAVVVQHLDHEERDLEPLMIPHFSSPEWKAVHKKFSRQPPRVAGPFFAWVTDGMRDDHAAYLRSTVPKPVVYILGRLLGRRYYRDVAPVWQSTSN